MNSFRELYEADMARYPEGKASEWLRRYHYYLRKTQTASNRILKRWYHFCFRLTGDQHRMEISYNAAIGKGFCMTYPFTITINSNAVIGENVTFGKNVTVGKQNRGDHAGTPIIGDRVIVGDNAVIVGKIKIGNDVEIAANSYINRDIPDHTKVEGNPFHIISES